MAENVRHQLWSSGSKILVLTVEPGDLAVTDKATRVSSLERAAITQIIGTGYSTHSVGDNPAVDFADALQRCGTRLDPYSKRLPR